jgi:methyltransferase (TIGR00027 family)
LTERTPSKTAVGAAALRAVHQMFDAEPKIFEDRVILSLLEPSVLEKIRQHSERYQSPRLLNLRSHILVRSRYIEDQLAEAAAGGVGQYVILGAGLDTFAYRQPTWARKLAIFEVDQAASQREKLDLLTRAGILAPTNLAYIAVDFEKQTLTSILPQYGFDPTRPAFLSWSGVMPYLNREAIEAVFRFAANLPVSSVIAFTFASSKSSVSTGMTENIAASLGEPWLTHFQPAELEQMLNGMGFSKISFLTPKQIEQRYIGNRQDGLSAFKGINTALAIV